MKKKNLLLTAVATLGLTASTMAQNVPNYVPTNGLVGWWPFNGNANDESGNGNNGTVNGATLTNDRFGNSNASIQFLQNQYIEIQSLYQNNISGYTISAWFKKSPTNANTDGAIVSGSYPGQAPGGLRLNMGTINRFQWQIEDFPGVNGILQNAPGDNNNYCDNNWHLVVSTFTSPNGLISASAFKIYIDGSLVQTISCNANWPTIDTTAFAPVNNGNRNTIIGNCGGNYFNFSNSFLGTLDDIGIWNRALTPQEITNLYNGCQLTVNTQPNSQTININNNTKFTVSSSDPSATYQWQTDLGIGFQNLNSVGQYSGTTNDTLTVSNVTMSNNNQPFRCIVSSGSCSDTSNIAVLTVNNNVGINETNQGNLLSLFPNPAQSIINVKTDSKLIGCVYSILDITGRIIQTGKIATENTEINLNTLSEGTYVLKINEQLNQSFRIIKN